MTLAAAIAAAALAGCGGSSSNSSSGPSLSAFKSGWQAQKASFAAIGTDLQTAIATASTTSAPKIASEFASLGSRMTHAASALRALKPPARYQTRVGQLAAAFDAVSGDMTAVSTAANHNDVTAARTAAAKLVTDWATIHAADLVLSHEFGFPVTGG